MATTLDKAPSRERRLADALGLACTAIEEVRRFVQDEAPHVPTDTELRRVLSVGRDALEVPETTLDDLIQHIWRWREKRLAQCQTPEERVWVNSTISEMHGVVTAYFD